MKKLIAALFIIFPLIIFASSEKSGMSSSQALLQLEEGNKRFVSGRMIHPNSDQHRRDLVAGGQNPFVTILSCSDSRVPVETIFDAGIGDIFVIRVAGNVSDTDEIATIEYGAEHLGTSLVVVLGHSSCGAVTAVVKKSELGENLAKLVDNIAKPVETAREKNKTGDESQIINSAIRENIFQSIADILIHSEIMRELIEKDKVKIVGGLYDIKSGSVTILGEHPDQKSIISNAQAHSGKETVKENNYNMLYLFIPFIVLLLSYFLFISEKRLFANIKIKGRLIASFLSIIASSYIVIWIILSEVPEKQNNTYFFIVSIYVLLLLFSFVITKSHITAFRKFFAELKKHEHNT